MLTSQKGALALLDMATAASATSANAGLSFATRARAIGAVFRLLPAETVAAIYPCVPRTWLPRACAAY